MMHLVTAVFVLVCVVGCSAGTLERDRRRNLDECLCYDSARGDWCHGWDDCGSYQGSVGILLAPCAVVVVCLLGFWLVVALRTFFNTCGGRKPSYGYLCPSKEDFAGYSSGDMRTLKVAATLFAVGCLVLISIGYQQSSKLNDGVFDVTDSTDKMAGTLLNAVVNANAAYGTLPNVSAEDARLFGEVVGHAQWQGERLQDILQKVRKYESQDTGSSRYYNTIYLFCFVGVVVLMGVISVGCMATKCVPMTIAGLLTLVCFVTCVGAAVYEYVAIVGDDVCSDYDHYTEGAVQWGKHELGCNSDGSKGVSVLFDLTHKAFSSFAEGECRETAALCNGTFDCVKCDETSLTTVLFKSQINASHNATCTRNQCSIAQCAEWCVEGDIRQQCVDIMESWMKYTPRFKAVRHALHPLEDCRIVDDFRTDVHGPVCHNVKEASHGLFACLLSVSCLMLALMVVLLLSTKRFAKPLYTTISHAHTPFVTGTVINDSTAPTTKSVALPPPTGCLYPAPHAATYGTSSTAL